MWSTSSFAHDTAPFSPCFRSDGIDWDGFSSAFPLPSSSSPKKIPTGVPSRGYTTSSNEHFLPSFMQGQWNPSGAEGSPSSPSPPFGTAATSAEKSTPKIEEEISNQNLYKTELCRSFEETGSCRYGPKCQFAHGKAELRPVLRHPKYKTQICKTFYSRGTCPYGRRCRFIHSVPGAESPEPSLPPTGRTNPSAPAGPPSPAVPHAGSTGEHVPFSTLHS